MFYNRIILIQDFLSQQIACYITFMVIYQTLIVLRETFSKKLNAKPIKYRDCPPEN